MYTDEDLTAAVEEGVFSEVAVEEFRNLISTLNNSSLIDEENFKLMGGFNDIFVVIACSLLLFSSFWVLGNFLLMPVLASLIFSVLSWLLAEFFVRKRRMAFPAIALLFAFVGGVIMLALSCIGADSGITIALVALFVASSTYLHWLRFHVPITIAVAVVVSIGFVISATFIIFPNMKDWFLLIIFICGILSFVFAMYWDSKDQNRTTRNSDVAFWVHLVSAPLIIHPVFSGLGVLDGNESILSMVGVVSLYLVITFISIVIDRRAIMVSALAYVLYALYNLIQTYGGVGYSFALTGVLVGCTLLLLSAYWHGVRSRLTSLLPVWINQYIPLNKMGS